MASYLGANTPPVPFLTIGGAGYAEGSNLTQNFVGFDSTTPSLQDIAAGKTATQFKIPDVQTLIIYAVVIFIVMKFIK